MPLTVRRRAKRDRYPPATPLGAPVERLVRRHGGRPEEGPGATTRVPKCKYFNLATADTIVEIIVNAHEMLSPYTFGPKVQRRCTNARFNAQKRYSEKNTPILDPSWNDAEQVIAGRLCPDII